MGSQPISIQQAAALACCQQGDTVPLKINISGFLMSARRKKEVKSTVKNTVPHLSAPPERWAEAKQVTGKHLKNWIFPGSYFPATAALLETKLPSLQLLPMEHTALC